ncbi:meiotic recombination protein SPO11 isoform X7 [Canis lupus familiaris]|uniref:meiotic recombination protein SPO11 isoform X7 n=1 Tax=Canis lupus dingo TaxID=286419 RepID=UPI0015F15B3E|nr:meiotic recombination protein SPO11 isoform X7 [Canis lupus dingo]XP_038290085.1 meiotic recombination protein SPO11 isoform X7 [Canis lupus familiaris]XP_038313882.1 meiotic recombination protein SPO11 isoform X7 [Canis lupus familiaris]XP_038428591.1 meiotic recombination protein SPO11 isoform X7 [Canis lupus familiaris]
MAFAPMGPEASFFAVLDQHRASLLAALRRGGGEPAGGGTPQASSFNLKKALRSVCEERKREACGETSSSEVLASIESVIQDIITSVARNEAPAFTIGNRSSWENIKFEDSVGLQMVTHFTTRKIKSDSLKSVKKFALILKILSKIYKLVQSNTYATKRDIYYTDSQLFGNQTVVDNIINDISCMLKVPRMSLHIAVAVPSNIQGIRNLITDAKFLLIVEKDATFQRLLDDNFCNRMSPCIMITGKGVPDLNTRLLVKKLWDTFHIPVFALVDADPHGIEIMCIYKYGSMAMSFEAHNLTVPAIRWLGLLPSDIKRLNIPRDTLIPLTKRDQMKLDSVLKRPYVTCQPFWRKESQRERGRNIGRGRSRLHAPRARCGIRSRISRIAPRAKGRR